MANQWNKIKSKQLDRLKALGAASFVEAGNQVFIKSPVDKGDFKSNWDANINSASSKPFVVGKGKDFNQAFDAMVKISNSYNIGDSLYLTNPAPYALKLEYGHSDQSPNGMVRVTAAQWPLIVGKIAKRLSK